MIKPRYRILDSAIPGAGKGLFVEQAMPAGSIIVAPDAIERTHRLDEIRSDPSLNAQAHSAARWFEDRYTLSPDWPDECYVNHSFRPSGLWHLGFIFAARELRPGDEVTVDYRHLLPPGEAEAFHDAETGGKIVGYSWDVSLAASTQALAALIA